MTDTNETPESTEVDIDGLRAALKSANEKAASNRHKVKELTEQLETTTQTAGKYKSSYISSKIGAALSEHGATNPKIVKVLDTSKIDLGDDGELVGFDQQLVAVKEEFPEFFDAKRRAPKIDAAERPVPKRALSSAEKLLQQTRNT